MLGAQPLPRHRVVKGQKRHIHGWRAPMPHHRLFAAANHFAAGAGVTPESKGFVVPTVADCHEFMGPVYNQGEVGDCGPHAWTSQRRALRKRLGLPDEDGSRHDLYDATRLAMGVPLTEDSGVDNTTMVATSINRGYCLEGTFPTSATDYQTPSPAAAEAEAPKHKSVRVYSLSTLAWIQACLGLKIPLIIGFSVPEHFETDTVNTGQLRMPEPGEQFVGGHDVCPYFLDMQHDNNDGTIGAIGCRNSWDYDFGLKDVVVMGAKRPGDFWMPVEYVRQQLADDPWTEHEEMP